MMTGHAYARALRGHLLLAAALIKLMTEQMPGCLTDISVEKLQDVHMLIMEGPCDSEMLLSTQSVIQLTYILETLLPTWDLKVVPGSCGLNTRGMLRLLIYAERTGDWDLHLYCVARMIPIFHASGYLAYARSSRRYLDPMKTLLDIMQPAQFKKLTKNGYFTIRRCHRFWSGNFTDQTIEQVLMRQLKAPGVWLMAEASPQAYKQSLFTSFLEVYLSAKRWRASVEYMPILGINTMTYEPPQRPFFIHVHCN